MGINYTWSTSVEWVRVGPWWLRLRGKKEPVSLCRDNKRNDDSTIYNQPEV